MSDEANMSGADEDGFLVAEYALGLLSPAEHAATQERLRREPALRADLGFWQARLSSLDSEFLETPAPAAIWNLLEKRLFGTAASGGFWNSLALWRGLAGAAAAVAVVAFGVNIMPPRGVVACFDATGQGVAVYSPDATEAWNVGPHGQGASDDPAAGPCMHVAPITTASLGPRSVFRFRAWLVVGNEREIATAIDAVTERTHAPRQPLAVPP